MFPEGLVVMCVMLTCFLENYLTKNVTEGGSIFLERRSLCLLHFCVRQLHKDRTV